jgi:hypothetical protein
MADKAISELGGEGVAVCTEDLISWVVYFSSIGVFSLETSSLYGGIYVGGEASVTIFFNLFAYMFGSSNILISLRVMKPTSSDVGR